MASALAKAEPFLLRASHEVRLLGAVTPTNVREERERLARRLAGGDAELPVWRYSPIDQRALARGLLELNLELRRVDAPLVALYAERAEELALEAELSGCPGKPRFAELARRRFARTEEISARALALARERAGDGPPPAGEAAASSDGAEPGSLLNRLREEIGRRRVPFTVRVVRGLSSLAATGERQVLVAEGRALHAEDVERTVLHEIEGHVLPRVLAERERCSLFRIGSAHGTDDQEGYALLLEERRGFLGARRMRELSARRIAVAAADEGATFADATRLLVTRHGFGAEEAVRIAERTFRGGTGGGPGLGRDRVYLESWLRVGDALAERPWLEGVLARGQVSVAAAHVLASYASREA